MRVAVVLTALLCLAAQARGGKPEVGPPLRVQERYVPFKAFRDLTRDRSDGLVMRLSEYRALLRDATARLQARPDEDMPPMSANLLSARYQGLPLEGMVRWQGQLEVQTTGPAWTRCDLGRALPGLGAVRVDGGPGWVVLDGERAFLLLQGAGLHRVELCFSLPVVQDEEWSHVTGALPPAAASSLLLSVSGRTHGKSGTGFLRTEEAQGETRFHLALGTAQGFELAWRRQAVGKENEILLTVGHELRYRPHPAHPAFVWEAQVQVARRAAETLDFVPPPLTTVTQVQGPLVHAWERTERGLRVILKEATQGLVALRFQGIFALEGGGFTLAAPRLEGAYADHGELAIVDTGTGRLAVESAQGLIELESGPPSADAESGVQGAVLRRYAYVSAQARLTGRLVERPLELEAHVAHLARIGAGALTLQSFVTLRVESGRTFRAAVLLPEGWRLVRVTERPAGPAGGVEARGLHLHQADGRLQLSLERAADPGHPLEFQMDLESTAFPAARDWRDRRADFALPTVADVGRCRTDLAIALAGGLHLGETQLAGWKALPQAQAQDILPPDQNSGRLALAVTTEAPAPAVGLGLRQRAVRGEYRAVVHLLAAERNFASAEGQHTLHLRCDILLAVVERGIDRLVLRHPALAEGIAVHVEGEGIKDVQSEATAGRQTIQFIRPWLGRRTLRLSYPLACTPGSDVALPTFSIEAAAAPGDPAPGAGDYQGEHFLVLQSEGSVQVEAAPGPGLGAIGLDELPDFAEPWPQGRIIAAFRARAAGARGSLKTRLHERAPVLTHLARELVLSTTIGLGGQFQTQAEFLLAYARDQSLRLRLPRGARGLTVTVNGEPIRALRNEAAAAPDEAAAAPTERGADAAAGPSYDIPLPPRSWARIAIFYTQEREDGPLGARGRFVAEGPSLEPIPVGETRWTIHHPEGQRWTLAGGNLREDAPGPALGHLIDNLILGPLAGRPLRFAVLEPLGPRRPLVQAPGPTPYERELAQKTQAAATSQLRPRGPEDQTPPSQRPGLFVTHLPEGRTIVLSKFGGDPRVVLDYAHETFQSGCTRLVFLATWLLALILHLGGHRLGLRRLVVWGLLLGALLPLALNRPSPYLLLPFTEALLPVALLLALGALRRRAGGGAGRLAALLLASLVILAGGGRSEAGKDAAVQQAARAPQPAPHPFPTEPFDEVLIPYGEARHPWSELEADPQVFLPKTRFQALWDLAHPVPVIPPPPFVGDLILGAGQYRLELVGERGRITGLVPLLVFTEGWVVLPLPQDGARLTRIALDGRDCGVTQIEGRPAIAMRGPRSRLEPAAHELDLEFELPLERAQGRFRLRAQLLGGSASTVAVELPSGARLEPGSAGAVQERGEGRTLVACDLGPAARLELAWNFPRIEGRASSALQSTSYTALGLTSDGCRIERQERLRVTGLPVETVSYAVLGGWRIASVEGPGIGAFEIDETAVPPQLRIHFKEALTEARYIITGRKVTQGEGELPTLRLEEAQRQESYLGLFHVGGRRWAAALPARLRRASLPELERYLGGAPQPPPDRVYHAYDSGEGERVAIEPVPGRAQLTSDAVFLVLEDRLVLSVRTRYRLTEQGPLRHVVDLPAGWVVRRVQAAGLRDWEAPLTPGGTRLTVHLGGRAQAGTEITWMAERPLAALPELLELPLPRAVAGGAAESAPEETLHWLLASDDEFQLVTARAEHLEPLPLGEAQPWAPLAEGQGYRYAYRSRRPDATLAVRPVLAGSQIGATVVQLARLADEAVTVQARARFLIRQAGAERFRLRLAAPAELLHAQVAHQRAQVLRRGNEGTEIELTLHERMRGEVDVDLIYRLSRAGGAEPVLRPLALADTQGRPLAADQYVAVLQTQRGVTLETVAEGLAPVPLERLPLVPQGLSAANLQPILRAHAPAWSLTLKTAALEADQPLGAIVQLADLTTRIGDDGTLRTRAAYTIINHGLQFLGLELPAGAGLWNVTVNGGPVAVGRDEAGALRIPIPRVARAGLPLEVILTYQQDPIALPALHELQALEGPTIRSERAVQVVQTIWSLSVPDAYWLREELGRMRRVPSSLRPAQRLEGLLEQYELAKEAAGQVQSRRQRAAASAELARLEQTLGDNLAELKESDQADREQSERYDQEELRRVGLRNRQIMDQAQAAQDFLRADLERRKQEAQQGEVDRDAEAFEDRVRFLQGVGWASDGPSPRGERAPKAQKGQAPQDGDGLESWRRLEAQPLPADAETVQANLLPAPKAPTALAEAQAGAATPAPDDFATRPSAVVHSFRRSDGEARLELRFIARRTLPAGLAWALLLGGGFALWRGRRMGGRASRG